MKKEMKQFNEPAMVVLNDVLTEEENAVSRPMVRPFSF